MKTNTHAHAPPQPSTLQWETENKVCDFVHSNKLLSADQIEAVLKFSLDFYRLNGRISNQTQTNTHSHVQDLRFNKSNLFDSIWNLIDFLKLANSVIYIVWQIGCKRTLVWFGQGHFTRVYDDSYHKFLSFVFLFSIALFWLLL